MVFCPPLPAPFQPTGAAGFLPPGSALWESDTRTGQLLPGSRAVSQATFCCPCPAHLPRGQFLPGGQPWWGLHLGR